MRFCVLLLLAPLVFCTKELPGEELPSKDNSLLGTEQANPEDEGNQVVKRSISEIAARRRSALDKNFMRFGRSDPNMPTEARVKMNNGNLMRFGRNKESGFMRLGRAKSADFIRFGRSPGNLMRFGRSPGNLMRFGRSNGNLMRFGRANNNLMRFGRSGNNLMRFGRANNNLMRFGRANNNLMRFGRANNNLMRFGRANNNLMRFGRSDDEFTNYESEPFFDEFTEDDQTPTISSDTYIREERSIKDGDSKYSNDGDDSRLGRALLQKNYEEEDESDDSNKEDNEKLKMFIDENLMRLSGDSDNVQDGDAFDVLFPEDSRKKRSLVKKLEEVEASSAPEQNTDGLSIKRINPEKIPRCSS